MKKILAIGLLAILLVAACSPASPEASPTEPPTAQQLPAETFPSMTPMSTELELATPVPPDMSANAAYPTSEGNVSTSTRQESSVDMRVENAWREGKQVFMELCYVMPDPEGNWMLWGALLSYSDTVLDMFGTVQSEDISHNIRCDTLEFYVPPDADLSTATLTVGSLMDQPKEFDYCDILMPKIQSAMTGAENGVTLACDLETGEMSVADTGSLSREDAEALVFDESWYSIAGPWEFVLHFDEPN